MFDQYKQLTLSPQLVRFTRLGSVTESVGVTKPEGSGKPLSASNLVYNVPMKSKMSLGSVKQAVSDFGQAAKDLVGSGKVPGLSGLTTAASKSSLASIHTTAEGTLGDVSDNAAGNLMETAVNGISLDWIEDDATSLLYTENGATENLPHHSSASRSSPVHTCLHS